MIGISVSKKDLLTETATNLLEQYGESITEELKKSLIESGHTASNKLLQSITWNPIIKTAGGKMVLEIVIEDYYQFVNDGRKGTKQKFTDDTSRMIGKRKAKAKLPPFQPISEWLGKHRSAKAKFNNGGKLRLGQTAKVTDKVKKAIIVDQIRYAIKRNGIEPTYFYTSVVNNNTITNLTKAVATAAGRDLVLNIKQK